MKKINLVQDAFLESLIKQRVKVSVYLINGIRLQGRVVSYGRFTIVLSGSIDEIVYKHAITTIGPENRATIR